MILFSKIVYTTDSGIHHVIKFTAEAKGESRLYKSRMTMLFAVSFIRTYYSVATFW